MSKAAFTPGPWEWDGDVCCYDPEHEAPWIIGADSSPVLTGEIHCENEANATLIAAAPDLLEALEPFAMFACSPPGECQCHNCKARDVIAKATGGQQ